MDTKELRQKTLKELQELIGEKRSKLLGLKFNLVSGKVKNIRELHRVKKDVAQILTIINEKK